MVLLLGNSTQRLSCRAFEAEQAQILQPYLPRSLASFWGGCAYVLDDPSLNGTLGVWDGLRGLLLIRTNLAWKCFASGSQKAVEKTGSGLSPLAQAPIFTFGKSVSSLTLAQLN